MNAWVNIEISPDNTEIRQIDKYEKKLATLSPDIQKIRELITRLELCHFKSKQHVTYIKESITTLKPVINLEQIGTHHVSKGKKAIKLDTTGRSILGLKYIEALTYWLNNTSETNQSEYDDKTLEKKIHSWLGQKTPDKEKLVKLVIARITGDWETYEILEKGEKHKGLIFQACRIDTCHYTFPNNLDLLLKGIGNLNPYPEFEGCGSYSKEIKNSAKDEFLALNHRLEELLSFSNPNIDTMITIWLTACLAKTIKEQVGLETPLKIIT